MRRAIAIAALALSAALPQVAESAPGAKNLWFANTGSCGTENPAFTLTASPADGGECSGTVLAVQGTGLILDQQYTTVKKDTFRIDVSRKLTGAVYFKHFPVVSVTSDSLPGYTTVDVTVKLGPTTLGTTRVSGVIPPAGALKGNLSFTIPAALKNTTVTRITVDVKWTDAVGLTGVSYSDPYASTLAVPVK